MYTILFVLSIIEILNETSQIVNFIILYSATTVESSYIGCFGKKLYTNKHRKIAISNMLICSRKILRNVMVKYIILWHVTDSVECQMYRYYVISWWQILCNVAGRNMWCHDFWYYIMSWLQIVCNVIVANIM